jgi:hypothetical protein
MPGESDNDFSTAMALHKKSAFGGTFCATRISAQKVCAECYKCSVMSDDDILDIPEPPKTPSPSQPGTQPKMLNKRSRMARKKKRGTQGPPAPVPTQETLWEKIWRLSDSNLFWGGGVGMAIAAYAFLIGGAPKFAIVLLVTAWLMMAVSIYRHNFFEGKSKRVRIIGQTLISGLLVIVLIVLWVSLRSNVTQSPAPFSPSFVFVKPGAWLNNDTWYFILEHRGAEPVYNIEVVFTDEDRRKAFASDNSKVELLKQSETTINHLEIDSGNFGQAKYFLWKPMTPEHENYSALISHRSGHVKQSIRIEKVNGQWAFATRVTDVDKNKTLLECRDTAFPIDQEWGANLPPCFPNFPISDQPIAQTQPVPSIIPMPAPSLLTATPAPRASVPQPRLSTGAAKQSPSATPDSIPSPQPTKSVSLVEGINEILTPKGGTVYCRVDVPGSAYEPSAPLSGALVTARNWRTGEKYKAETNSWGEARLRVSSGTYSVSATHSGYSQDEQVVIVSESDVLASSPSITIRLRLWRL